VLVLFPLNSVHCLSIFQVANALSTLGSPQIEEDVTGDKIWSKFWCYFCSEDVQQHLAFDSRSYLANSGLLEHISRLFVSQIFVYCFIIFSF